MSLLTHEKNINLDLSEFLGGQNKLHQHLDKKM